MKQETAGTLPGKKDLDRRSLNMMHKKCDVKDGLIVCKRYDQVANSDRNVVFVPEEFLDSVLTVLHI